MQETDIKAEPCLVVAIDFVWLGSAHSPMAGPYLKYSVVKELVPGVPGDVKQNAHFIRDIVTSRINIGFSRHG